MMCDSASGACSGGCGGCGGRDPAAGVPEPESFAPRTSGVVCLWWLTLTEGVYGVYSAYTCLILLSTRYSEMTLDGPLMTWEGVICFCGWLLGG